MLLSFHDYTLKVETTRYLGKVHGIQIISEIIFLLDENCWYKNWRHITYMKVFSSYSATSFIGFAFVSCSFAS